MGFSSLKEPKSIKKGIGNGDFPEIIAFPFVVLYFSNTKFWAKSPFF
jgi:hypothetical protein